MAKNKYLEPNKVTLVEWVDKALQQSLKKENIKIKVQGLWNLAIESYSCG